nr:unnamed protein product [Callosobruchus analis]
MLAAYNCPSTRHKVLPAQCSYPLFRKAASLGKLKLKYHILLFVTYTLILSWQLSQNFRNYKKRLMF